MPTRVRRPLWSAPGAVTSMSSTVILPAWTGSRALMQRSSVDFPEPERPITAMISPFSTLSETPFRTSRGPKRLTMLSTLTRDMHTPLQNLAELRKAEADDEVDRRGDEIDLQRGEGRRGHDLGRAGQFHEADQRRERSVLHQLHEEADGGRDGDADGLRDDHVAEPHAIGEAERGAGFPLPVRHRLQGAAPDL